MYSADEIEAIVSENEYLNNKLRLLEGGFAGGSMFSVARQRTDAKSIAGLQEAYLVFDSRQTVLQINSKMCDLLGISKDDTIHKKTLADIDTLSWAPNVFTTLIRESQATGDRKSVV